MTLCQSTASRTWKLIGYTWKLEGSLKVIEDKFGEDTKPVVMLKQDQFGSVFDRPESLYNTG